MSAAGIWIAMLFSGVIGLSLGLVGGGGSIITVPVLVYIAGLEPRAAVPLSLAIVGATAAAGAALQGRAGHIHAKAAAWFGITGVAGAAIGARITPRVPAPVLLLLFALLMIAVGVRMLLDRSADPPPAGEGCEGLRCGVAGLGVGVLTGFLGVGGGFLLVPALLKYARLPMRRAAATSLLVIAANSAAGVLSHLGEWRGESWIAVAFTVSALAGLVGGIRLAGRVRPARLKKVFGGVALGVAVYLVAVNLGPFLGLLSHRGGG